MYIQIRELIKRNMNEDTFFWKCMEFLQGTFFVFNYLKFYKMNNNDSSITELNIEFASACNLRCVWCSLDHDKPKNLITKSILTKVLDSLINDNRFKNVELINLHNGGETLLHPKRIEMLQLIKDYKLKANEKNKKFPKIYLLTNALVLNEKLSKEIINLDLIDKIRFSLDGGTPESFEQIRVNAKWSIFYNNVTSFCQQNAIHGHPIKTESITIIPGDNPLNTKWMHPEFVEVLHLMDHFELRRMHNWAGDIEIPESLRNKKHKIGCNLLMNQMVLLPNGDITVCCSDLNSSGVVGNIQYDNLFDIYKSKLRRDYLKKHIRGKKDEIELCKNCATF